MGKIPNMNEERADWAEEALETFCDTTGVRPENDGLDTCIADLLCDLMHLCDRYGLDFDYLADHGRGHWREETSEKESDGDLGPPCKRRKLPGPLSYEGSKKVAVKP